METEIKVDYYNDAGYSHSYTHIYRHEASTHCVDCGKRGVWATGDDYYWGPRMICTHCGKYFHLPHEAYSMRLNTERQEMAGLLKAEARQKEKE